ncbi:MAG: response regulator [Chloroflexota bacterium]|nr:response regulator [Chloroflexota bacterium]
MTQVQGERNHQDEGAQLERRHVFVVNSSPEFLDLMRDLLQDEHYNVTTTNHVPRTFDQVEVLQPDVLVIDVAVGERAGWDLLDRLHAEASTNNIPVLVISTDPRLLERARAAASRHGRSAFLAKPFDLEVMLGVIQELIGPA